MIQSRMIALIDEKVARLIRVERRPRDRIGAVELDSIDNRWLDYHEHRRPDQLDQTPGPAGATPHFVSSSGTDSEKDEERRRFARDIEPWLAGCCAAEDQSPADVRAFVSSSMLSPLRRELEQQKTTMQVNELGLAHLALDKLAEHPAIRQLLVSHPG